MTNDPSYSSPKSSRRDSSDINFNDVFGGPPRRVSIQEFRYSFGESTDSSARRSDDETTQFRHRRSGLAEKPVFGDDGGNGRRYPSEGFFGDIFRGNEFLSSSPRKHDRDLFSLSPASRVMSPVRPLPPKAEPFGTPSLPAQFSLHKNKDGASTAMAYPYSPLSRSSSHGQGDLTRQSSVSEELSLVKEECLSSLTKLDETDKGNSSKRHSKSSEVAANGTQFHFSIYRWASKGVPLPMPLGSRLKNKHKLERHLRANGMIACETGEKELLTETPRDADSVSFTCSGSPVIESLRTELAKKENGTLANIGNWGRVDGCQIVNDVASNTKSETSITNAIIEGDVTETSITNAVIEGDVTEPSIANAVIEGDVTSDAIQESEEMRTHSIPDMDLSKKTVKKSSAVTRKDAQNELKLLRSPFFYQDNAKSIDLTTRKSESKEIKVKNTKKSSAVFGVNEKLKKQDGNLTALFNENVDKANQPNLQSSPANSLDNLGKNRVRGKVKEFVKIFNQEALKEIKPDANSQNQSYERKGRSKLETKHEASVRKNEMTNADNGSTPATIVVADEYLNQSENLHHETKTGNFKSTDKSSGIRNSSVSSPSSIPDGSEAFVGDTDESFQVSFLIKELDENVIEVPQTEEIQAVDAKIRKWSNGKEGNIRSLISTLQYVLWSGSGWKPVPLADIIEGNAVKRSYQKALLCLHPDKLQQKGATSEQKYIAEKVFDILQEAWTYFNTLGAA